MNNLNYKVFLLSILLASASFSQFGFQRTNTSTVSKDGSIQKHAWAGGLDYCQFSNIDLDFDGVEDLFIFDRTANKVLTFLQKGGVGETNYEYAPEYEKDFPAGLHDWALLVDYNCDGKKDLFTYEIGGGSVFLNTGDETTGNKFELVVPILQTLIYSDLTYLFLSSQDIPAIVDVDGDGDKDILGFGVLGTALEYHKNLSMELYGTCDSLEFETKNLCWGRFREDASTNEVSLYDTLNFPCREEDLGDEFILPGGYIEERQDRHVGSTVLALDMDNSGVLDLILGDAAFNTLTMLLNSGTEVNANSAMSEQDNTFPSTSVPVDLPIFPGAYHVDINNDNIRDLLVSPASKIASENVQSVWRYINEGADLEPDFIYSENDFLQGGMIDVGTTSYPVFFDHDGDGLEDLLVSSQGQYDPISGNQISKIAYYRNIGTATTPNFEFVTDDYQDLSTKGIGTSLVFYPTFGDLDGDGDEDMILGEFSGFNYYMENTGGAGNPAIFNTFVTLANSDGELIFDGTFTYPNLVDLDRDGDLDLAIGRRTGKISYFENTGIGTYNFVPKSTNLGNVDVSGISSIEGHAITQFIELDGEYQLVVGSKSGYLYYFDDIEGNLDGSFHLVDVSIDNINIGTFSAPAITNLNGNNRFEMILGNRRGGVSFFESAPTTNIGITSIENDNDISIYPNPSSDQITIDLGPMNAKSLEQTTISIVSIDGQLVYQVAPNTNLLEVDVNQFAKGSYIIQVINEGKPINKKLIIE